MTVIVGPNGSGKTAILDAIWFGLMDEIGYRLQRVGFRVGPEYVVRHGSNYAKVDFEVEISQEELEQVNKWKDALNDLSNSKEFAGPTQRTANLEWTYPAQMGYNRRGYRYANPESHLVMRGREYYSRLKKRVAERLEDNLGGVYFFEEERRIVERPVKTLPQATKDEAVDPDIRALLVDFGIKHQLRNYSGDISWYQRVRDGFNAICYPNTMGDVYALPNEGEYEIEFRDRHQVKYGFDGLSSGERSVINFLVQYVYRRMRHAIVLIDELETHLHPTWQQNLLRYLSHTGDGNQFIITTHSPTVQMAAHSDATIQLGSLDELPEWQYEGFENVNDR